MFRTLVTFVMMYCFLVPNIVFSTGVQSTEETLFGVLRMIAAEHQDEKTGEMVLDQYIYGLETENGFVPIETKQDLTNLVNQSVKVGFDKVGKVVVGQIESTSKSVENSLVPGDLLVPPPTAGERKTLVIMVNFASWPTPAVTESQVRDIVFTGAYSANTFLKEASFHRFWLTGHQRPDGDIQTWINIPFDGSDCNTNMFNAWTQAADEIAETNGFSKTEYVLRKYMFPTIPGCQWTALATVGILGDPTAMRRAWYQLPTDPDLLSTKVKPVYHEVGHMVGVNWHSAGQTSEGGPIADSGDRGDFMAGVGYYPHIINRVRLGWLAGKPPVTVVAPEVIPGVPQTYTLISPAVVNKRAFHGIRIPLKDAAGNFVGKSIWIEGRKNMSSLYEYFLFNQRHYVSGIAIRYIEDDLTSQVSRPIIRDMTPGTTFGYDDAPLQQGLVYTDSTYGVNIELMVASDTLGDKVKVTITR